MLGTQEQLSSSTPITTGNLKTMKSTWPGNLQHTQTSQLSSGSSTLTKPSESELGNLMTSCSLTLHASKTLFPIITSTQRPHNIMTLSTKNLPQIMTPCNLS